MELETASNADAETMSVTTTTSDNERQFMLLETSNIGDDDIFFNPDIEVAKEASLVDEQLQLCKRKEEFFNKEVNVFDIFLENTSVFLAANAKQPLSKDPADNITLGYTSKIQVSERFKKLCRDIYTETGIYESSKAENSNPSSEQTSQLRFEVHSRPLQTSIKVDVNGIDVSLSDEIVSQLAPFIQMILKMTVHPFWRFLYKIVI
uniref:Uncharacterized protein n=1 Tax=Ditylenchus dipsaci TaxID=166011 RepID=A0A915ED78_9BILA